MSKARAYALFLSRRRSRVLAPSSPPFFHCLFYPLTFLMASWKHESFPKEDGPLASRPKDAGSTTDGTSGLLRVAIRMNGGLLGSADTSEPFGVASGTVRIS